MIRLRAVYLRARYRSLFCVAFLAGFIPALVLVLAFTRASPA